nr:TANK-binding kinase 1-binding protein 1-like [Drosophila kikkawai]
MTATTATRPSDTTPPRRTVVTSGGGAPHRLTPAPAGLRHIWAKWKPPWSSASGKSRKALSIGGHRRQHAVNHLGRRGRDQPGQRQGPSLQVATPALDPAQRHSRRDSVPPRLGTLHRRPCQIPSALLRGNIWPWTIPRSSHHRPMCRGDPSRDPRPRLPTIAELAAEQARQRAEDLGELGIPPAVPPPADDPPPPTPTPPSTAPERTMGRQPDQFVRRIIAGHRRGSPQPSPLGACPGGMDHAERHFAGRPTPPDPRPTRDSSTTDDSSSGGGGESTLPRPNK